MTDRRQFVQMIPACAIVFAIAPVANAQAAKIDEADPTAVALGYKHDAAKVDAKKFTSYAPGRNCAGCQLYTAKPTEPWGPCAIFGGKQVNAKGWCSAWAKRA